MAHLGGQALQTVAPQIQHLQSAEKKHWRFCMGIHTIVFEAERYLVRWPMSQETWVSLLFPR